MADALFPILLVAVCLALIMVPPRYDPAFLIAEWLERRRKR